LAAALQIGFDVDPKRRRNFAPEFELLLACCRPDKSDVTQLLESRLNWERILQMAEHHRLVPALYAGIGPQPGIPPQLRSRARNHCWRSMQLTVELMRIAEHFKVREIQFLAHKGPVLAKALYGNSAMRQFGDLDLLVKPHDVPRARAALVELGYGPRLQLSAGLERAYLRSGYEYVFGLGPERHLVELQWQIVPRFYSIAFDIDELFRRSIETRLDHATMRILRDEDLVLVLCVHAAKHGWSQLGMLRDISTLVQRDLDWKWILREAQKLGIFKILQISLSTACELFQLMPPEMLQRGPCFPKVLQIAGQITKNLQSNRDPDIESISYFRSQIQTRERWPDRTRFVWRLLSTPSISEWESVQIPYWLSGGYRVIRIARLVKKLLNGTANRFRGSTRKSRQLARARGNSSAPEAPTPHGEIPAAAPLLSNTEILPECRNAQ
jgi:Uncharacterised nucleotidyltransferase